MLVGGGSGGHIVPNLAIVTELLSNHKKLEVFYIGSRLPLDRELVEQAKLPFYPIFTGKFRRYFSWRNFIDPFFLFIGVIQSIFLLIKLKPSVVFSKGGFVSVPVAMAGFLLRIPIILHESDSVMGLSNRIVSKFAKKIAISFPKVIKVSKKVVFTGNPVRSSILNGNKKRGYQLTGFTNNKPVVLIWGGSLGAEQINHLVQKEFNELMREFRVIHITGRGKEVHLNHKNYVQFQYIHNDLKDIYAITDLVVGRAGANSLYELALIQRPNICIPLTLNQDQLKNADYFSDNGATILFRKGQSLCRLLFDLWSDKKRYKAMQEALKKISRPNANHNIAQLILENISL